MRKHIAYLVLKEGRPFSFGDFLTFEADGTQYRMSRGTFRNKVSDLSKKGVIEVAYYSSAAFYTLKGVNFSKQTTSDHTGGTLSSTSICSPQELRRIKNHPVYRVIQNTPYDNCALHDIHLRFTVNGIWSLLSRIPSLTMDANSKDILVIKEEINDLDIRVTVHHSDTVSVVIGCTYSPVAVDIQGVTRLSDALILINDRLQRLVEEAKNCGANCNENSGSPLITIPNHTTWAVTMWHFGVDSSIEYTGERFSASWKVAQNALIAIYSKQWKDGIYRIRGERKEFPGKSLGEALEEKLKLIGRCK
jgi:hypothetical protein